MNIFLKLKNDYGNQEKAAKAVGVSTTTFSDWINQVKAPSLENMLRLQDMGFSGDEILLSCRTKSSSTSLENEHG